jgi:HD-GYP domain-containing protein (c-di-GMP phosphodiesterase class II)/DNA-binding CsgD family transcriptional regulator
MVGNGAAGRMAELTVALSLATDLGLGQPLEHGLRTCLLSLAAAEELGLDGPSRSCVYHVALLRFVGCTADASETAALVGGDEQAFLRAMAPMAAANAGDGARHVVRHLGEGLPLPRRAALLARALADTGWERRSLSGHCEVAARLATRIGLAGPVAEALGHAYERWDGKGHPDGLAGEAVPVAVRVVTVARDVELWDRQGGWPAVADVLRRRRGRAHDPAVVDAFLVDGQRWLAGIGDDPCRQALDAEPAPVAAIPGEGLDAALAAVADHTDLQSPWRRGHSTGVADLVAGAGRAAGLGDPDVALLRGAALVHDVGRVGVPSAIWDHAGPLTTEQWERVRLHPYLTERVLRRCPLLTPFAEVAARHHERADGSGYHRGDAGGALSFEARLLAAADAYHAMTEARAHRPALAPSQAESELRAAVASGALGGAEVDAVLAAAGHAGTVAPRPRPANLTEREVEVLALIARGRANKQVAAALGISAKTVGRHVEHIYAKAGVHTRAGATLFAMEHGLLA